MQSNRIVKFYRFSAYLLLLGVIHAALTPLFYDFFTPNGMWFFGSGLALIFLSALNIAASRILQKWLLRLVLAANIIGVVYSTLLTYVLSEPQAYIGLVFHLSVLIGSYRTLMLEKKQQFTKNNSLI